MSHQNFPGAPRVNTAQTLDELRTKTDEIARAVNLAMSGKVNAVNNHEFPLTLTAGAASTVLTDPRLSATSVVLFDPQTANAAAEQAAGTMYVLTANRRIGAWTVTHANNGQTDRTFAYLIIG